MYVLIPLSSLDEHLTHLFLALYLSRQPYALAIALISIFFIFIVEIIAFRWGSAKLARLGISHDPHGHNHQQHDIGVPFAHGPSLVDDPRVSVERSSSSSQPDIVEKERDLEAGQPDRSGTALSHKHTFPSEKVHEGHGHGQEGGLVDSAVTQILGVAILEFGVLLHRYPIFDVSDFDPH